MEERKKDHIELAFKSKTGRDTVDPRFYYEPMLVSHPNGLPCLFDFNGKSMKAPLWVSSMTGGTKMAGHINRNLARACQEFGLGMGLGSCRIILDDDSYFADFDMREVIGNQPLFANLGIAQLEEMLRKGDLSPVHRLISRLRADGLIIHVNPMQEWFQPEGDKLYHPPLETISRLLYETDYPVIVKEVGQGMGPDSLRALLALPLLAVEFAAFGGTNFAQLELMRRPHHQKELFEPLVHIGVDAYEMNQLVNQIVEEGEVKTSSVIISGGIENYLDGYYLIQRSRLPAIYGQASAFLKHAQGDYDELQSWVASQIKGLEMAYAYLKVRN